MHTVLPRYTALHHICERVHFVALPVGLLRRLAHVAAMRVTLLMLLLGHVLLGAAQICRVLAEASYVMITEHRVVHVLNVSTSLHVISDRDGAVLVLLTHGG